MFKGFYNLTSGMLTQGRNLDVVANNMTNISTSGYKADRYVASTFKDVLISRVGNKDKTGAQEIGSSSYILASSEVATDYTQGTLETTGMPLDFAIEGAGFFGVQTANSVAYTRGGNFSLDNQGYLYLPGQGRVLGQNGQPILMQTDKITSDNFGRIYGETGNLIGQLGVFTFADTAVLTRNDQGLFVGGGATVNANAKVHWRAQERSNVELVQQMTQMMSSQRALQSAAQVSKMYDQLISKVTNDIGRL